MATSGDLDLATSGYFFMATDNQDGEIGAAPTKFLHRGDRGGARP